MAVKGESDKFQISEAELANWVSYEVVPGDDRKPQSFEEIGDAAFFRQQQPKGDRLKIVRKGGYN